jgi:hypothetical protein
MYYLICFSEMLRRAKQKINEFDPEAVRVEFVVDRAALRPEHVQTLHIYISSSEV